MSVLALLKSVFFSLTLTIVFELLFAKVFRFSSLRLIIGANLLTNPPLVCLCLLLPLYTGISKLPLLVFLEICAVFAEGLVYKKNAVCSRPLLFSLGANGFSFFIGELLQALI